LIFDELFWVVEAVGWFEISEALVEENMM